MVKQIAWPFLMHKKRTSARISTCSNAIYLINLYKRSNT